MNKMNHKLWLAILLICLAYFPFNLQAGEARSCNQFSAKTLNKKADPYKKLIEKAAKKYDVDADLIKSVIASESCFREMVTSCKGAAGLMQLMPETATELGVFDIYDPKENIDAGTRYLSRLLKRYGGSVTHAVAAYNAGAGRIEADAPVTVSFKETRGYINNVLNALAKLESPKPDNAENYGKAQLLLADWQYAEEVYQAALRGEVLPPQRPATTPEPDTTQPQVMLAVLQNPQAANAQIVPAALLATTSTAEHSVSDSQNLPTTVGTGLSDCQHLPAALTQQTQMQGSGRYRAFFYTVRGSETLQQVSERLGITSLNIIELSNLPIGDNTATVALTVGERLKVAECSY